MIRQYSLGELERDAEDIAHAIDRNKYTALYGIPAGGIPLAFALSKITGIPIVDEPYEEVAEGGNCLIVDDLVDSGKTISRFEGFDVVTLHVKEHTPPGSRPMYYVENVGSAWVHYFWEGDAQEKSVTDHVTRLLEYVGEDPHRDGLEETPMRVAKALRFLTGGYDMNVDAIFKDFENPGYNEMVLLRNIEIYSLCEHHMMPFFGKAHVAYIPNGRVVGISKLARLVDMFARRLQIQERLCNQITETIMDKLGATGAACVIEAKHLCMLMRGVEKQNSVMVTSSLRGAFMEKPEARAEFMAFIKGGRDHG